MINADIVWLRDDPDFALDIFSAALGTEEQETLASFRLPERQRSFILSRTLLRHVLAPKLGINKKEIRFLRTDSGRLTLANKSPWQFSLSHSAGLIAVIVAEANCGVDIEVPHTIGFAKIAQRYFSDAENIWLAQCDGAARERDFFKLWTLKEASVKALHEGLANNLSRVAFDLSAKSPMLIDPALDLQVFQQIEGDVFLAGAVRSSAEISWQVRSLQVSDL